MFSWNWVLMKHNRKNNEDYNADSRQESDFDYKAFGDLDQITKCVLKKGRTFINNILTCLKCVSRIRYFLKKKAHKC